MKIRHKLFLTLLLTSVAISAGLFFYLQWNFERAFLHYVVSQELFLAEKMADYMGYEYAKHGNWNFAKNLATFSEVPLAEQAETGRTSFSASDFYFSPLLKQRNMKPRVILYDAGRQRIAGASTANRPSSPVYLAPINYNDEIVGYISLTLPTKLSQSKDLLFVKQQKETFVIIMLVMIGISMAVTFPFTIQLLRPIKELTRGTKRLISGNYKTPIPLRSTDELGQLSYDFNILSDVLDKNEKARRQWVADISHELRTPIAILRGELEAIVDGIRMPSIQTIEPLHGEILHLERLVNDLYELSMSDTGAMTYKMIQVNPAGILEECVDAFQPRFAQKGLTLSSSIKGITGKPLNADPNRLQQLFSNLLENSIRYTNAPGNLSITMTEKNNAIHILFEDTPPGVTKEQLPQLFNRLYRADTSRKRLNSGAGLGLTICRNIVEAHHGIITAENARTGGLAFHIYLPLS